MGVREYLLSHTLLKGVHYFIHVLSIFFCVISGVRREVHENCAVLGYYAASNGNLLPKFLDIP